MTPTKWTPVSRLREARFGGRSKVGKSCSIKKIKRHDDSKKSHPALMRGLRFASGAGKTVHQLDILGQIGGLAGVHDPAVIENISPVSD